MTECLEWDKEEIKNGELDVVTKGLEETEERRSLKTKRWVLNMMLSRIRMIRYFCFFFLMIRHPPRSTLFPTPTLFRSRRQGNRRRASCCLVHPAIGPPSSCV